MNKFFHIEINLKKIWQFANYMIFLNIYLISILIKARRLDKILLFYYFSIVLSMVDILYYENREKENYK